MADDSKGGGSLYGRPDLINAAERSNIDRSMRDRYAGIANGLGILADAVRYRPKRSDNPQFEMVIATGLIRGTSSPASVAYAGSGANRDWCIGTSIFERNDTEMVRYSSAEETIAALRRTTKDVDIVFIDDLGENLVADLQTDFVHIPAWVKQRVRLESDWPTQIRSLKRGLRQEVSRVIRKYGYECRLAGNAAEISRFYDQQYRPFVSSLYGRSAIIVDRDRFVRECRRGVLLQLIDHEAVVASALLRPVGRTMAIVWTGMRPGADCKRIPGATDALDYFSLLYTHLKGYRWLDFGPSRTDLCDGTLRYKRKWGSELITGHFRQPPIYWTCNGDNNAVRDFLRRHMFISNRKGQLTCLTFMFDNNDAEMLRRTMEHQITPGISEYRVVSLSPVSRALRTDLNRIHPDINVIETQSVADAMRLAS